MGKTKTTEHLLPVYDYVIVGGGTAGCVLASRLSENEARTVLLLEAGCDDREFPDVHIPAKHGTLVRSILDWSNKSLPQRHSCSASRNRQTFLARGKGLGGGGSVNAMIYVRGTPQDFDLWEKMGCEGWGYEAVLPYFIKSENCTCPELLKGGVHGTDGPMTVTQCLSTSLGDNFVQAAKELGFKHTDMNGRDPIGVMKTQLNTDDGRRCHTAEAFLRPAMHSHNLHIATHCHVTKLLIDNDIARAVEFVRMSGRGIVRARREIILSSGAIGSAQILMLSGIGPREHLESLGIPVVADLPVGSFLQDHTVVHGIQFELDKSLYDGGDVFSKENQNRYDLMRSGPIATSLIDGVGFYTDPTNPNDNNASIETSLHGCLQVYSWKENMRIKGEVWEATFPGRPEHESTGFSLFPILCHPRSKGTVRLHSTNPFYPPDIDPNYLTDPQDVKLLVEAMKICRRFGETKAFRSMGARLVECVLPEYRGAPYTDEYWAEYAMALTSAGYHFVGTCRMGKADDPTTVTDSQLRVKGIGRLRVVDASVMTEITSGNTNAPTVMIAEKAADMIKGVKIFKL